MNAAAGCLAVSLLAPLGAVAQEPIRDFSLDVIEELGRELYRRDMAASVATDVLLAQRLNLDDFPLRGYVVTEDRKGFLVTFVGEYDAEIKAVFDVRPDQKASPRFALAEQRELSKEEAAQFRALNVARREITEPCSDRYNSVVLDDPETDGQIVYLLAASKEPGAIVVGGHYRVTVSASGEEVLAADRLSSACMTASPPDKSAGPSVAFVVTHLVSDTPVETHVFLSLLHDEPMVVLTSEKTAWIVIEGDIERFELPEVEEP
ncbi:MAG TPA: hypothetical protein VNA66_04555 [Gammaproteobacteria bacterium]|nr:hypothetical protein [Gammaproteobacteria bacterium]